MSDPRSPIHSQQFIRINMNSMGHPRYVLGYIHLLTQAEQQARGDAISNAPTISAISAVIDDYYQIALKRAKAIGGRKYSTKSYCLGIVFVSFSLDETIQYIEEALTSAENFQRAPN